ncbi:SDR family NAD(P)-dependent oxidoreductase [Aquibaculum arenosum]|uniref:SDR family NAD(P)-dependent oxidoreductase n=1 Tax=Aquibaculum arenosum TaxID=3032591 RepID=A0ABT5YK79_9PROT|nr:SDR family NAD(P)-dependent oxidoreductase [Fodinicurvata sp. CAU 1616]MDF2095355.1 SDR family NAD(P)-dependent oxidoreductase [Fodinicurvata sp. CAU 1616]
MKPDRAGNKGFGITEWFRPFEYERVDECLLHLTNLGASHLRTHLSWADFHVEGVPEWYDWLIPRLAEHVDLLPCVHYTPPSLSRTGTTAGPPRRLRDLADFVDQVLDRYGSHFTHLELWNEPNNLLDWDWRADRGWHQFCEMIVAAAHWTEHRSWKAVLGGPGPFDIEWLKMVGRQGVLEQVSAVGIHGFPGTWDSETGIWTGWETQITQLRQVLSEYQPHAEIWITEAGYSTWRHDELEQVRRFLEAVDAPAERLYWYSLCDLPLDADIQEGRQFDMRHYHVGLLDRRGRDKLLAQLLRRGGIASARRKLHMVGRGIDAPQLKPSGRRPVLITGGSGFIGCNLAHALLSEGQEVILFDNLSRSGVAANLEWLRAHHGERAIIQTADLRDTTAVADAVGACSAVVHLAAQVAVTESLESPLEDFAINAGGTLTLLEALRRRGEKVPLVFASTNKVYGCLPDLPLHRGDAGYLPSDPDVLARGLGENQSLQFATPYGCSKGAADQYVLDYAASFGLPAVVLRMSCIYGQRQFGTEDQGWVAHFLIKALNDEPITLFGDGFQVRDVLHVDDAVRAYRLLLKNAEGLAGQVFNLGGGPGNAVSLLTMLSEIEALLGRPVERQHAPMRAGDQRYFVADTGRLEAATGWCASVPWRDGLQQLCSWLQQQSPVEGLPGQKKDPAWSVSA